jgi:hypothetical protein
MFNVPGMCPTAKSALVRTSITAAPAATARSSDVRSSCASSRGAGMVGGSSRFTIFILAK